MLRDINPGEYDSKPDWITDADGLVFFRAFEGTHSRELWALLDPSDCHYLTLGAMGAGAAPMADPAQSDGCDAGLYETGEIISLTAVPAPGWEVSGWTGSDDDGSTLLVNQVTMPGIDHAVVVSYRELPFFVDGFESGDCSIWSVVVGLQ